MSDLFMLNTCDLNSVSKEFESVRFKCFDALIGNAKLQAFCCHFETVNELQKSWVELVSLLTSEVLVCQGRSFERRNTYVLFTCSDFIPKSLRYEIENDKFSVRKLVATEFSYEVTDEVVVQYLNKKILASDLNLNSSEVFRNEPGLSIVSQRVIGEFEKDESNKLSDDKFFKNWLAKQLSTEA